MTSTERECGRLHIFLAGGSGFIGGHVLRELLSRDHNVTCLLRSGSRPLTKHPRLREIEGDWTRPEAWLMGVAGHDVVVNTVGIIRERRGSTFDAVHTTTPIALVDAAVSVGVKAVLQVSAMGADETAVSRFHRSKRAADDYLSHAGIPHVILRPSFVYGAGDHSMSFFRRLALLPVTPVPGDGQYLVQPLHIEDLTRAIVAAIEQPLLRDVTVDVGGALVLTFDNLLDTLARRHGRARGCRKLHIPWSIMRAIATATDRFGGHGPITRDELNMLRRGNYADNRPFIDHFGFEPRPFEG